MKNILRADPELYGACHVWVNLGSTWPISPSNLPTGFLKNQQYTLPVTLVLFHGANLFINPWSGFEVISICHFGGQIGSKLPS